MKDLQKRQKNANKYISDIRLDDKIDLVLWEKGILNNYLTFNFLKVLYGISNSPARIFIEHTQMSLLKVCLRLYQAGSE